MASGGRFEFRAVDSACNPYLTQAALLRAGLDGVKRKLDPGPPQQRNVYDVLAEGERDPARARRTSARRSRRSRRTTWCAARCPAVSTMCIMHYKRDEWERFLAAVTDWERERYLDILP